MADTITSVVNTPSDEIVNRTGNNAFTGDNTHAGSETFNGTTTFNSLLYGSKFQITIEGGYAIKLVAGENLAVGEVVYVKQADGADGKVWKNPVDGDMPIGVCYASASADASVWVVVSGIVGVLPESGVTATRGYVIYSSNSEAGRVDEATSVPAAITHFKECGHWLDTGSGAGVITRAIIHFN